MSIGKRIKSRRCELGLTVDELAAKLNKNRATIYRYESDEIENLPISVLEPLAEVLKTTPAYLMGWNEKDEIDHSGFYVSIPSVNSKDEDIKDLINSLMAPNENDSADNIESLERSKAKLIEFLSNAIFYSEEDASQIPIFETPSDLIENKPKDYYRTLTLPPNCFAVKMDDSSMEPKIPEGCIVIIKQNHSPNSGDFVLVQIESSFAIRKYQEHSSGISLVALNPSFQPLFYPESEINDNSFKIIGVVDRWLFIIEEDDVDDEYRTRAILYDDAID